MTNLIIHHLKKKGEFCAITGLISGFSEKGTLRVKILSTKLFYKCRGSDQFFTKLHQEISYHKLIKKGETRTAWYIVNVAIISAAGGHDFTVTVKTGLSSLINDSNINAHKNKFNKRVPRHFA